MQLGFGREAFGLPPLPLAPRLRRYYLLPPLPNPGTTSQALLPEMAANGRMVEMVSDGGDGTGESGKIRFLARLVQAQDFPK